jgi:hypothetical protein
VISGPHLRDFECNQRYGRIPPEIVAAVFKHPRRSVSMSRPTRHCSGSQADVWNTGEFDAPPLCGDGL